MKFGRWMTYTEQRPTVREIDKKIKAAKKAVCEKKTYIANLLKIYSDFNDLEIYDTEEIWSHIQALLEELTSENYCGGHPPEEAREKEIQGEDLYAFCWQSKKYQKKMYLKFAIVDEYFYLASIHESRR
jgi:hypothetical protein